MNLLDPTTKPLHSREEKRDRCLARKRLLSLKRFVGAVECEFCGARSTGAAEIDAAVGKRPDCPSLSYLNFDCGRLTLREPHFDCRAFTDVLQSRALPPR